MKARLTMLATVALLSVAGCAGNDKAATQAPAALPTKPTLSPIDAMFFDNASRAGIEEVTFGQLARDHASRASVKAFAVRMVDKHTMINQDLTQLAQSKGVTPPTKMDSMHDELFAKLQGLHGRAFDTAYLNGQATDHQKTLTLFQDEAQNGVDPDVKAFAAKNAPVIQSHLDAARRLGGRVQPAAAS